jgi:hypothetical protein
MYVWGRPGNRVAISGWDSYSSSSHCPDWPWVQRSLLSCGVSEVLFFPNVELTPQSTCWGWYAFLVWCLKKQGGQLWIFTFFERKDFPCHLLQRFGSKFHQISLLVFGVGSVEDAFFLKFVLHTKLQVEMARDYQRQVKDLDVCKSFRAKQLSLACSGRTTVSPLFRYLGDVVVVFTAESWDYLHKQKAKSVGVAHFCESAKNSYMRQNDVCEFLLFCPPDTN